MIYTLEFLNSYSTNSGVLLGFLTVASLTIFMGLLKERSKLFCKPCKDLTKEDVTPTAQQIILFVLLVLFSVLIYRLIDSSLYTLDLFSQIRLAEGSENVYDKVIWTEEAVNTYRKAWESYFYTVKILKCINILFFIIGSFFSNFLSNI